MEKPEKIESKGTGAIGMRDDAQQIIMKQLRTQTFFAKVSAIACCGIFLVLFVSALILVPRINTAVTAADETIVKANETIDAVNELTETANASLGDITAASNSANDLIVANAENLTEVIEKINKIDFDSLNESIEALHDTIAPFQKVVGVIGALTGK